MIAVNNPENLRPEPAETTPCHWLAGRYFVPLPDLSDETRQAIYGGRSAAAWLEITSRLHTLERRGADRKADADEQARQQARQQAAFTGRIEGLGVNGLAAALGCSHTTALKYLRHLEALGLIRTEQGDFTVEADPTTGKIRRNYAKAPPKVIIITIQDRHLRPCFPSQTRRGGTPETVLNPRGGTPETGGKSREHQARNWRVSKDGNLQRGSHPSLDGNKRRTAAGPLGRPAAAASKTQREQRPARTWSTWSDPATCPKGRQFVAAIAATLNMTPAEVTAVPPGEKRHELIERYRQAKAAPHDPNSEWQRQADEDARERGRKAMVDHLAIGLGLKSFEVIAMWKAAPDELKRQAIEAGLLTPEGKIRRLGGYGRGMLSEQRTAARQEAAGWLSEQRAAGQEVAA